MKILFVSDLHLGDGSGADDFGNNDDRFLKWLENLAPNEVYFVGDTADMWQFGMKKIRKKHPKIVSFMESKLVSKVIGNHDYELLGPNDIIITAGNKKILVVHGHQGDKNMGNPLVRGIVWFLAIPERLGLKNIDNPEKLWFTRKQYLKCIMTTEAYAKKRLKKFDIVICGHSHQQEVKTYEDGKVYANCGTCMGGHFQGILFETEDGTIRMV